MKAHEAYHVEALHLVAGNIDVLMEFVIKIQKLRRIVLKIELLKLDVSVELLDVLFGCDVAGFFKKCGLYCDTKEPGFLNEFIVDQGNTAALLGKDVYDLGLGQLQECFVNRCS